MVPDRRDEIFDDLIKEAKDLIHRKGKDYAGDADCLENFKEEARDTDLSIFQVWHVYLNKHLSAIKRAIRRSPFSPQVASEPLKSRLADCINYLVLFQCMLEEADLIQLPLFKDLPCDDQRNYKNLVDEETI